MNSFEDISVNEVIGSVKMFLGNEGITTSDRFIELMILDANRKLMSVKNVVQKCITLDACNCQVELPCDYDSFIALTTPPKAEDGVDNEMPFLYSNNAYPTIEDRWNTRPFGNRFTIESSEGVIRFPSNLNIETVNLYYWGYRTDDNGFPLLKLSHIDYYTAYAIHWVYLKQRDLQMAAIFERKFKNAKATQIHNEVVDNFELDKVGITSIVRSIGLGGYGGYYNYGFNYGIAL
jgi:hypothetical protein